MFEFSGVSKAKLRSCHPLLQELFNVVIQFFDCTIIEGHRSQARQDVLYAEGKTQVRRSKHNAEPSLAVDVAPYPIDWNDKERFYMFGGYVLGVADMLGIGIRWGGDWDDDNDIRDQRFIDLVHFELRDVQEQI